MKSTRWLLLLAALCLLLPACSPNGGGEGPATDTSAENPTISKGEESVSTEPKESPYPVPAAYESYLAEAQKLVTDTDADNPHYSLSGDSSNYAWGTSYAMQALYTAYRVTKDTAFADVYAKTCQNLLSTLADRDEDGFLGWGTGGYSAGGEYEEFAVHTGLTLKGLADFILLVRSDPALAGRAVGGETFGAIAERARKAADEELVPSFEKDFSAALCVYMNRPGSGNYSGATGAYTLPHNQYLAMTSALYTMALVSPERAELYLGRADTQARVFKSWLNVKDDGFVTWNYDDTFHTGDHTNTMAEDFSHAMIDYQAAAEAYNRGLYGPLDMARFADNVTDNMFNGKWDEAKIAFRVSGGRRAEMSGEPYIYHMLLSPFGEAVWPVCEAGFTGRVSDAALLLAWHPGAPAPGPFELTAPEKSGEVDPRCAVFMWTPSQHAADYTLEISKTEDFASVEVRRPHIAAVGALVDSLEGGTQYFWRVAARNAAGDTAYSGVSGFKTAAKAELSPKVLTFEYKAETDRPPEGRTLRVYLYRELVAEENISPGAWQSFSLDLTEQIGLSSTAGIKIALFSDNAEPAGEALHLKDIALSNGAAAEEAAAPFFSGRPLIYTRRGAFEAAGGEIKLALPLFADVKHFSSYAGLGKIVNEISADVGFVFP